MNHLVKILLAGALTLLPLAAQSDLGTSTNGGALSDGRTPNDDRIIDLQKKEMKKYEAAIPKLLGTSLSEVSDQYVSVRQGGKSIGPLDFLATLKVLRGRTPAPSFMEMSVMIVAPDKASKTPQVKQPSKAEINEAKAEFRKFK